MKKVSKKQKKHLKSSQALILKRNARRHQRKLQKENGNKDKRWWDRSIDAPVYFSLSEEENHAELMNFIQSIYDNEKTNEVLRINFRNTRQMMVDALLLFVANLEKAIQQDHIFSSIRIAPSKKRSVNAVLTQIGVLKLCNQDFHINPEEEEGIVYWRCLSGLVSKKLKPEEIFNFLKEAINQEPPRVLSKGISEALLNIKHHAYRENNSGTWWMLAHKNEETKKYLIVVCDVGVGIPISINEGSEDYHKDIQAKLFDFFKKIGRKATDSEMIEVSMEVGKSRTGKTYRGKGLPAMKKVVEQFPDQSLMLNIYSNNGCFTQMSNKKKPILTQSNNSIKGTVVTWSIPLNVDDMIKI